MYYRSKIFFPKKTYAMYGEDLKVIDFFKRKKKGFYVDIGCYHPIKGSLTYNLFKKGWSGINVDLSKVSIDLFQISRPNDLNIQAAITNFDGETFYYENGIINQQNSLKENSNLNKIPIKAFKLSTILSKNKFTKIDLLNIDVEGYDFEALSSLNFSEVKPTMICIEENNFNTQKIIDSKTHKLLSENGYLFERDNRPPKQF